MVIDYFDTSAILANGKLLDEESYVSHFVVSELEEIKNSSSKDEQVKANARAATRALISNPQCRTYNLDLQKIERIRKSRKWLPDNMDGRIIAEAILLQKMTGANICFWTADYNMKLFAEAEDFYINFVSQECILNKEPWCGWGKYFPGTDEMASLYSNPQINTLGAKTNEYCTVFEGSDLKDILRWDGNSYNKLNYRSFKSALGSKVEPRNTEQKMLFDLLQNRNVPIKLCLGRFGSGKSYLMLAHALNLIQKGEFDRIVFVKNNIQVKDTKDLGALPGEEVDKLMPWLKQIEDHVGGFTFDDMLQQSVIEPVHLGYIRGRDIKNSIIFCDEVENMTKQHIQLLIGRVSSRSELWLAGDLKQTDSINFEKNSGIRALINGLAGDPLFGMVKLLKSERSAVAALADKLD